MRSQANRAASRTLADLLPGSGALLKRWSTGPPVEIGPSVLAFTHWPNKRKHRAREIDLLVLVGFWGTGFQSATSRLKLVDFGRLSGFVWEVCKHLNMGIETLLGV